MMDEGDEDIEIDVVSLMEVENYEDTSQETVFISSQNASGNVLEHVNPELLSDNASAARAQANSPTLSAEDSNHSEGSQSDLSANEPLPKKRIFSDEEKEDDGALCTICLDNWTNTGEHRVCSLKCGHLFGYKCILRWINCKKKKTCPTCKENVLKNDIRFIYAKRLIAVDTTELENMRSKLDLMIEERNRTLIELAKSNCREQVLTQEITRLKLFNNIVNQQAVVPRIIERRPDRVLMYMDKSLEVCRFGGSRVFDAKCDLDLLMVSVKSTTSLFNGFGLKRISISNYKPTAFIPLHSLQIRDICFHPENNWVLTASMDKTFKVVDNNSNSVIYNLSHQMPLWSCCWDLNNSFSLYVGAQSGAVVKYDVRNLTDAVATFSIEGDMSPVVSVASIPASPDSVLPQGGIISCKLNSLWLYEGTEAEATRHSISLEGPFVSMKYQTCSKQLLVSSRPNSRITYSRHTLGILEKKDNGIMDCNIIHSFQGGGMQKLLSKSCFLSNSTDYVAAHQEDSKSVFLWSINTGEKVCSVAAHESVLDLKGLNTSNGVYLVSLTDHKLDFFKFV